MQAVPAAVEASIIMPTKRKNMTSPQKSMLNQMKHPILPGCIKVSQEDIKYVQNLPPDELKERYFKICEDFLILKKFTQDQEDKIMRLKTKLQKIVTDCKKEMNTSNVASMKLREIDLTEEISCLKQTVSQLELKNKNLEAKLQVANVQLSSAKQNKVPLLYHHITARVNTGLKHSKKAKSLTNISRPSSARSSLETGRVKVRPNRSGSFSDDQNDSSTLTQFSVAAGMSEEVRVVLEDARKRIIELEEDQEQLLQQLSDAQQMLETERREDGVKVSSLERELESRREELREQQLQEQRDKTALIRSERQNRAASSRMMALSDHVNDLEAKLCQEKRLKDEALEAVEIQKIDEAAQASRMKECELARDKLSDEVEALKENCLYLKKQVKQLQVENERLSEMCLQENNSETSKKRNENRVSLHRDLKQAYEQLDIERREVSGLRAQLSKEEGQIQALTADVERLKLERDELRNVNQQLKETIKVSESPKLTKEECNLDLLKKTVENLQEQKINVYEKMAFDELQTKYTELQIIYREKTRELDRVLLLLNGHADTYDHLQKKNELLEANLKEEILGMKEQLKEQEESFKRREEVISSLENQLLRLSQPGVELPGLNLGEQRSKDEAIDSVALNKHHNLLELNLDKAVFTTNFGDKFKTFVSWLMPFSLRDPLQHSNFAMGSVALYTHTSLYKFKMSYHNFQAIMQDDIKVKIYCLPASNHPRRIGECRLSLADLLTNPRDILQGTSSIERSPEEDSQNELGFSIQESSPIIGVLHYSARFHRSAKDYLEKFRCKLSGEERLTLTWVAEKDLKESSKSMDTSVMASKNFHFHLEKCLGISNSVEKTPDHSKLTEKPLIHQKIIKTPPESSLSSPKPNDESSGSSKSTEKSKYSLKSSSKPLAMIKSTEKDPKSSSSEKYRKSPRKCIQPSESLKSLHPSKFASESSQSSKTSEELRESSKSASSKMTKRTPPSLHSPQGSPGTLIQMASIDSPQSSSGHTLHPSGGSPQRAPGHINSSVSKEVLPVSLQRGSPIDVEMKRREKRSKKEYKKSKGMSKENEKLDRIKLKKTQRSSFQFPKKFKNVFRSKKSSEGSEDVPSIAKKIKAIKRTKLFSSKRRHGREGDGISRGEDHPCEDSSEEEIRDENNDVTSSTRSDTYFEESLSSSEHSSTTSSASLLSEETVEENDEERSISEDIRGKRGSNANSRERERKRNHSESSSKLPLSLASPPSAKIQQILNGTLRIGIDGMELKDRLLVEDPTVQYLFVDYIGFLDLKPEAVETPQSLPKPKLGQRIDFNFVKDIPINEEENPVRFKAFKDLLKDNGPIKFNLASEPPSDQQEESCKEIGFGTLSANALFKGFEGGIELYDVLGQCVLGTLFISSSFTVLP